MFIWFIRILVGFALPNSCSMKYSIGEEFVETQQNFLAKHCILFDDEEENKLAYMDIFHDYVCIVCY